MDCSLPGSSVHGISQARVLEWGAIAFSALQGDSLPSEPPLGNKKGWTTNTCNNLVKSPENFLREKSSQSYILYDSIYIEVVKWQNYRSEEQIGGSQGLRSRWGWKVNMKHPCGHRKKFYIQTLSINVSILVGVVQYSFARCYYRKLGKVHGISVVLLTIPCESTMTSKAQMVKNLPAMQETWVWPLGWEDPLEKGRATHFSILAGEFQARMDRGAWWATVYGDTKSRTQLSD